MYLPFLGVISTYHRDRYKSLSQLPQQQWRAVLMPLALGTCALGVTHRIHDGGRLGPKFGYLKTYETRVALLSIASSIIWHVILRDPQGFLRLHRPSSRYRCAVIIVSAATTIPNLALLILVLVGSLATPSLYGSHLNTSVLYSLIHLSVFLGVSGLYLWVAKRFLLDADVTLYEPVIPIRESFSRAPSASSPSTEETRQLSEGYLSRAYALQRASHPPHIGELSQLDLSGEARAIETEPAPRTTGSHGPDPSRAATSGPALHEQASSLRCPTMAQFDYMRQAWAWPHSWLSDWFLLMGMGAYSTIILVLVCIILYEDHFSRFPSPNAKCGLRAPLGCYLVCAYALQRASRPSSFVRSHMSLPEPWIKIRSLIGKPVFIDSDTAASTGVDPRLRAFPAEGPDRSTGIGCSEYIRRYNSNPASCTEYWGHLGRAWNRRARATPLYLLLYLGFAYFLYGGGFRCISDYPYSLGKDIWSDPRISIPDIKRAGRIRSLILAVRACNLIFGYPIHLYSVLSFFSFLGLWASAIKAMKSKGSLNTR